MQKIELDEVIHSLTHSLTHSPTRSFNENSLIAFAEDLEFDEVADFSFAVDHRSKGHFLHITGREAEA